VPSGWFLIVVRVVLSDIFTIGLGKFCHSHRGDGFLGLDFKFEGVVLKDIYNFNMKKLLLSISLIFAVAQAWAVDTYNPANGQLSIPTVVVGDKLYSNVVVSISGVVAVNCGDVNSYWDTYNSSNGQLTIPAVTVGSITYNNVVNSTYNQFNS